MAVSGMAVVHLITLGVLGELVVGTSDLSHTKLPRFKKILYKREQEQVSKNDQIDAIVHSSGVNVLHNEIVTNQIN